MKSYYIQQNIRPLVNQYVIREGDEAGDVIAFAQQKRLALKEKITFYTAEDKKNVAFEVSARQVMDFGARYDVKDAESKVIAVIGKNFKSSLLRSTWNMYNDDSDDPIYIAKERSQLLALLRRVWGFVPIIGEVPFLFKYHFDITDSNTQEVIASYEKVSTIRDKYQLAIHDEDILKNTDYRAFIALGVMMDALQGR